jgi:hypothetical protein
MPEAKSLRVWDASECVLMFIDYQDDVYNEIAPLQASPEFQKPHGLMAAKHA